MKTQTKNKSQSVWKAVCIAAASASFRGETPEGEIMYALKEYGISPIVLEVGDKHYSWNIHCFKCSSSLDKNCPTIPKIAWGSDQVAANKSNDIEPLTQEVISRIIQSREAFLSHTSDLFQNA